MQKIILIFTLSFFLDLGLSCMEPLANATFQTIFENDEVEEFKQYFPGPVPPLLLAQAASKGALKCIQLMLTKGARINGEDFNIKRNPVYCALINHEYRTADFLCTKGADLSTQCVCTVQHCRAQTIINHLIGHGSLAENLPQVAWLLQRGANFHEYVPNEFKVYTLKIVQTLKQKIK